MPPGSQLTDRQGNKVSAAHLYVFTDTLSAIQAEQNRIRDREGSKPSAAIVVQRMLEVYESHQEVQQAGDSISLAGLTPDERESAQELLKTYTELTESQRARIDSLAYSLHHGKKSRQVECPDELVKMVAGLIKFMTRPEHELDPALIEMRPVLKRMLER